MQSDNLRTVVITGTNKGIGYETVHRLLGQSTPLDIIITARNDKRGQEALTSLSKRHPSSSSRLTFHQLDISDSNSIDKFIEWIKEERNAKVDVLVNNAGVFFDAEELVEERLETLKINFLGTVELTEKLLPYLSKDGKIINISSENGQLSWQGKIRKVLEDPSLTREKIMKITDELAESCKTGKHKELGWSSPIYDATKVLLNAYTRWVLVKMVQGDQQCYTVDPGWCRTEMGGPSAPLPVERGADTPVFLINLPFKSDEKYNGKFLRDCKVIDF